MCSDLCSPGSKASWGKNSLPPKAVAYFPEKLAGFNAVRISGGNIGS